jgi:hypothetical protein
VADKLLGGIVINEVLVDPNGANNFDTDGNGTASPLDEFIEFYNTSNVAIDISGLELWDSGTGLWFTFPPGTTLQPGAFATVVIGVQAGGSLPTGNANDLFFDAGRGTAVLNNGSDNIVLYDPASDTYISATYNGDTPDDPTTDYPGFSATATQVGGGEAFGTDIDGFSIARSPDGSDTFTNNQTPTPGSANVCFTRGTTFETTDGPVLIENLRAGDWLKTHDQGDQKIRWIWSRTWHKSELEQHPNLKPIRIKCGALGHGLPKRDLLVSRHHRLLVSSPIVERMFGTTKALAPAKDLLAQEGVDIADDVQEVTYYHILLESHAIVFAESVPVESLFLGEQALRGIDPAAINELCRIFNTRPARLWQAASDPAYLFISGNRARMLFHRHAKHSMPIVDPRYKAGPQLDGRLA